MIKVLYDNDGFIKEFWAVNVIPDSQYIEISEETHKKIAGKDNFKIIDGKLADISNSQEYIDLQETKNKEQKIQALKEEINTVEKEQNRAIREMIIFPNETAKNRLHELNKKIEKLRSQL